MDGEEDEFMSGSGSHSDDGGGTPVQDEHQTSDMEDMSSNKHNSEDEGSNAEEASYSKRQDDSDSENDARRGADSDSEAEAPARHGNYSQRSDSETPVDREDPGSDSEAEPPRPADSDDDDDSVGKRRPSASEDEDGAPVKRAVSDAEEGEASSPMGHRESGSDAGKAAATDSDSDNEDGKVKSAAYSDSDTETPAERKAVVPDSGDESDTRQGDVEKGGGGKWKAVVRSDSEEDDDGEGRKGGGDAERSDGGPREVQKASDDSDDDNEQPVKRKKAILSDSDEDEQTDKPAVKRSRAVSDDDGNSDSDSESGGIDKSMAAKLRELGSDSSSDDDERTKGAAEGKDEKALFGSDSDDDHDNQEEKMIADIFGESGDEEEEEFTGFNQEDLEGDKKETKEKQPEMEDSDSDEGVRHGGHDTSFMSDFDIMLARKKAMSGKRRRPRDGGTFISDADDVVSAMITKMNEAAEEDRTLNSAKKPALKKLTLLPQVVMHLKKQDLKETFIDCGVMSAIKEWISPLPDKSLPALRIREELLRVLQELPSVSQETLKHSGIGRAVMFLYKHPKESRSNKDLALKLINEWSRPIFGLTSNYKGMTREERQQRDLDQQMPQRRRLSSGGQTPRRDLEKQLTGEEKALRPGDPGFCARARVPMPSNKDYVVRPKWNVEMESSRGPMKKGMSRVDKQMRRFADIRRLTKTGHAVKISVEGNRMPL
ncbi:protein IWS1 homolog isoform X1 [Corythoichthys intestinalis]|uniref:protein IWS1 homolog isoform X1 n=2 Tax=Corythoichthys intestinalis TaxID=161448 RepID=UPI0025A54F02|nr:protein IWS1 homolog isoform X1 [Corythoichthys intestinalis]XP_061797628.1 protein IWS1 homolog [Nerophis lumbriciformis]